MHFLEKQRIRPRISLKRQHGEADVGLPHVAGRLAVRAALTNDVVVAGQADRKNKPEPVRIRGPRHPPVAPLEPGNPRGLRETAPRPCVSTPRGRSLGRPVHGATRA